MKPTAAELAACEFASSSDRLELEPLGKGLINDTFRVAEGSNCWVLQRINRQVFKEPEAVMANLRRLTDHAERARRGCPDEPMRLPAVIPTRSGADLFCDDSGECWRAISYIHNTRTLHAIGSPEEAREVGRTLGWFHALVSTLKPENLHDTLPGFHVTPTYLESFDRVRAATRIPQPESDGLREALDFVDTRRAQADALEQARSRGHIKECVIHGDPKLDNMLFDAETGRGVSLIDLDTVKPGLLHYDLGDCLRSSCNIAGEGARPSEALFELGIFRSILQGYWTEAAPILTANDRDYLFTAIWLLPFELGLRFLTDHLAGDRYFKVQCPGQNLQRALGQFALTRSIETQAGAITEILESMA